MRRARSSVTNRERTKAAPAAPARRIARKFSGVIPSQKPAEAGSPDKGEEVLQTHRLKPGAKAVRLKPAVPDILRLPSRQSLLGPVPVRSWRLGHHRFGASAVRSAARAESRTSGLLVSQGVDGVGGCVPQERFLGW